MVRFALFKSNYEYCAIFFKTHPKDCALLWVFRPILFQFFPLWLDMCFLSKT